MSTPAIESFEPGIYIKLNDVFTGQRKMARVTDTGTSYLDLEGDNATPFPIYADLQPIEVGNVLGWGLYVVDNFPDRADEFRALVDRLINSGTDVLTYNRAIHWAFENSIYDYEKALAAGQSETDAVRAGRSQMDAVLAGAEEGETS